MTRYGLAREAHGVRRVKSAALVTHSGSVFSALLRTRRAFGFTLAVSSGQELITPDAYARYALTLAETKILALVLETVRDATALRSRSTWPPSSHRQPGPLPLTSHPRFPQPSSPPRHSMDVESVLL